MYRHERLPSQELLAQVMVVAEVRATLPLRSQGLLSEGLGVYCVVRHLPGGAKLYQAGGKFRPRLTFTVDRSGIVVGSYSPGDWEDKVAEACQRAAHLAQTLEEQQP